MLSLSIHFNSLLWNAYDYLSSYTTIGYAPLIHSKIIDVLIYFVEKRDNQYNILISGGHDPQNSSVVEQYGDPDEDLVAAHDTKTLQITKDPVTNQWGTLVSAFLPIVKNGTVLGVLGADYDISYVNKLKQGIVLSLFIAILAAVILALALSSSIVNPIQEVERVADALVGMNFEVDIRKFRSDEIGKMQRSLLKIRDSLHKALEELNNHLAKMTWSSKHLNTVIVESSDALGVIAGTMDAMQNKADSQIQSVKNVSVSIAEITGHIDSLDQAVKTQSSHITQSSAAIEQMVANVDSIRSVVAGEIRKLAELSGKESGAVSAEIKKMEQVITQIGKVSQKTMEDMGLIFTEINAMNSSFDIRLVR